MTTCLNEYRRGTIETYDLIVCMYPHGSKSRPWPRGSRPWPWSNDFCLKYITACLFKFNTCQHIWLQTMAAREGSQDKQLRIANEKRSINAHTYHKLCVNLWIGSKSMQQRNVGPKSVIVSQLHNFSRLVYFMPTRCGSS